MLMSGIVDTLGGKEGDRFVDTIALLFGRALSKLVQAGFTRDEAVQIIVATAGKKS